MLVDDDPGIRDTLGEYLGMNGMIVLQAGSGVECREIAQETRVDLAILDLNLPDENGLSLCKFLRQTSSMAIIMLTGASDLVERVVGLEIGADDYIAKPFELREVLARARSVLRRSSNPAGISIEGAHDNLRYFETDDRVLLTILFTDIVGSTKLAARLGDQSWFGKLKRFYAIGEDGIAANGGINIKSTGDGVMAAFDTPARAIRAAVAIQAEAKDLGLELRAGVHTGECVLNGDDVAGVAVHVASRVLGYAGPNDIVVSSTVKELMTGSDARFVDHGQHELRGLDDPWRLYLYERDSP